MNENKERALDYTAIQKKIQREHRMLVIYAVMRVALFPVMLPVAVIHRLYKWTYSEILDWVS